MTCDRPIYIDKNKYLPGVPVPVMCGKCPPCLKRRKGAWIFRLLQEDKISSNAHFITLTYTPESVPEAPSGRLTLCKADVQKFIKRLRKLNAEKIKYYAVGEYGETYSRPHYHGIFFNVADPLSFEKAWTLEGCLLGVVDVGSVSGASIAYTLDYMDKKKKIPEYLGDDRLPEFSLMSKGLGKNYLTPETIKYHREHLEDNYIQQIGGAKIPIPRFYHEKIFTDEEKSWQMSIMRETIDHTERYERYKASLKGLDYEDWKHERAMARHRNHQLKAGKNRKLEL